MAWFHEKDWKAIGTEPGVAHVKPLGDLILHTLSEDCICGPTLEITTYDDGPDGHVYTHHALDGRQ